MCYFAAANRAGARGRLFLPKYSRRDMHDEREDRPPRRRAVLLENIHPGAAARLEAAGFDVETYPGSFDESQLVDRIGEVDLLGIRSRTRVSDVVL